MHRISGWAVPNPQLHSLWKEKFKCALLPSVLLSRTLGHVTPPPDRLKYHLASVIFSLCWYKQTMNKYLFHYYFQFHLRVGCRVVVFFSLSEKQRLLSGLQDYRVWSSGAISLSSQLPFTLLPRNLLLLNHLLINGVNIWDVEMFISFSMQQRWVEHIQQSEGYGAMFATHL